MIISVSGCTGIGPESNLLGAKRVTTASPNEMLNASFEQLNDEQLLQLLDPESEGGFDPESKKNFAKLGYSLRMSYLRQAFYNANTKYGAPTELKALAHRSQIQDRLIAASEQRCNLYETYLKRLSTINNGIFGILTTSLGGAGAIVKGESTARLLSGLAGISSGARAELNQAIFESVATSVIIPAMRIRRKEIRTAIRSRRGESLASYTVEAAVGDAIRYHGSCSMDSGIGQAQRSLESFEDIGVDRLSNILRKQHLIRNESIAFQLDEIGSLVIAEFVVNGLKTRLTGSYQARLDQPADEKLQETLKAKLAELTTKVADEGELFTQASTLDKTLTERLFKYYAAVGSDKAAALNIVQEQQRSARNFQQAIEAEETAIRLLIERM